LTETVVAQQLKVSRGPYAKRFFNLPKKVC
jgi:hypothetical protein